MIDDCELLRHYAEKGDQTAFAELVRRRIDLVYSIALRTTGGDAHRAQDAAQRVFTDLARKAAALADRPVLTGWLYRSARFAAADLVRAELRRQQRETEARHMHDATDRSPELNWEELRPELDEMLARLNERDRDALLLRFFDGQSFAAIGQRLRLSEDAARMRVERALEKLRNQLARRGIRSAAAALGGALAGQAAIAAPAGAAASIVAAATAGATTVAGVAGWLGIFAMNKTQAIIAGAILIAGVTPVVVEVRASRTLTAEFRALQAASDQERRLERENEQLRTALEDSGEAGAAAAELARLHARIAQLSARPTGVTDAGLRAPMNLGRDTPAAAIETFCWAIDRRDLDLIAGMMAFSDDTKENREAFMANVSPVVRARYQTPERLCAAACFPNVVGGAADPVVGMQLLDVREAGDEARISLWMRTASGREFRGNDRYQRRNDGWGIAPFSLRDEKIRELVRSRLDPRTGDPVLPRR